jgi:Rhodopirellula transposase DDE domain
VPLAPWTSKWNKIEHRLFSFIRINWRGKPLRSFRTIVELIAATTTETGLTVRAELDEKKYPKGQRAKGPKGQRAKGPKGQRAKGPKGQRAKGPKGQRAKGPRVSDAQLATVNLLRHDFHGEWNYTIAPNKKDRPKKK